MFLLKKLNLNCCCLLLYNITFYINVLNHYVYVKSQCLQVMLFKINNKIICSEINKAVTFLSYEFSNITEGNLL